MAGEREIFKLSGPRHLTNVDYSDPNHRRCIAASLVQGVKVQELDRQARRVGPEAEASMWWSFFDFTLLHSLIDRDDGSIFGAVYKWREKASDLPTRPPGAPKIVAAFRGTVKKPDSLARDLRLDLNILTNDLHTTRRFHTAFKAVKSSVYKHGAENVWIAGHSLGAAMAMLAGRKMAEEEGQFLQAHLFNPPFISLPVERIKSEKLKHVFHMVHSLVTAGLAMTLKDSRARAESDRSFSVLRSWMPCLYVNPRDDVCSGYAGYFGNQQVMKEMACVGIANLAAQHSIKEIVLSVFGKDSKAGHLIPCARLTVNLSPSPDFKRAHGIHQWWAADIKIRCTEYRLFPVETSAGMISVEPKTVLYLELPN